MKTTKLIGAARHTVRSNSSTILTALGVSGVVTTAYLTGQASFKAAKIIADDEARRGSPVGSMGRFKEHGRLVWKHYIPAIVCGTASVTCIISAQRVGNRKTAAAQAAFSLSERAFSEYREKVIEQFGDTKEQKIRDELAQDRVNRDKPPTSQVLVTGPGHVLCYEAFTGRYLVSDMETLRKAENDLNARLIAHTYAYLDDFYDLIGLAPTSQSCEFGWDSDKMLELEWTTVLADGGKPCLSFSYNYVKLL